MPVFSIEDAIALIKKDKEKTSEIEKAMDQFFLLNLPRNIVEINNEYSTGDITQIIRNKRMSGYTNFNKKRYKSHYIVPLDNNRRFLVYDGKKEIKRQNSDYSLEVRNTAIENELKKLEHYEAKKRSLVKKRKSYIGNIVEHNLKKRDSIRAEKDNGNKMDFQ